MKEENKDKTKTVSNKSIKKIIFFIFLAVIIVIISARYITDEEFRNFVNSNILRKEVSESTLTSIEIDADKNPSVYAYDKYICILNENKFIEYNSDGKIEAELDVNISVPLVSTDGKYIAIAEKGGQKLYLISGTNIVWQTEVEGSISNIKVNENGYVSIVIKDTTYKSVVAFYDASGVEQFKIFLSTSYVVCTDISPNNNYLAIGEVDYYGTVIKSIVKIYSVEKARQNPDPNYSTIYTYESDNNEIITNINYQNKDYAICMFNNYIQKVTIDSNERLYDVTEDDLFIDINLKDSIAIVDKQSSGLFSYEYEVIIKNTNTNLENLYILDSDLPKTIYICGNNIGINLSNEVQFVNSNGWLLKKYTSSQQIQNLVIGDSIAGIIYKNKIEIIKL